MVTFDGNSLVWGKKRMAPAIRKFSEMRPVLAYPDSKNQLEPDTPTYFMYREAERIRSIRYDVTRIPALDLSGECNKTFGHTHPKTIKGTGWPEVYEVLSGEAHTLLQKVSQLGVEDAILITSKKGDVIIIPPNYGHVTINPGKKELVMGNLVSDNFSADYSQFALRHGACFYETSKGKIELNQNYGGGFELRKATARAFSEKFGCFAPFEKKDLLSAAKKFEDIEFLEKPELFF
jgi:glucose-6-phosphate isomerase